MKKMFKLEDFRSKNSVILDTCFILHELLNNREKRLIDFCSENLVLVTSFNVEELKKVSRKLGHNKRVVRDFLNRADLVFVDVPVHLGDVEGERAFVDALSSDILKKVRDPSDAVLVAAAILSNSVILTRDKHHLFTSTLSNELRKYNLSVFNDLSKVVFV